MGQNTVKITDANFKTEVESSPIPVLVDFWAEWCGPCRMVGPVLEELAPVYEGKLKIGKVNVDENPDAPSRFGVMNIPTMILFKGGKETARIIGALGRQELQKRLDQALG